ncbi:armadillo-type protein [Dichotomocladium elegans]|nr:armadillo-type protein [Dichotomocladium elegans]
MAIDEFEPDDMLTEINRKLANVALTNLAFGPGDLVDKSTLPTVKHYLNTSKSRERECFQSVQMIRKYLTQGSATASQGVTDEILALNILPRLRELLGEDSVPDLQFEVAWIVTNIAAGTSDQVQPLISEGFIPALLECLQSPSVKISVKAQAAWALSNFAGESPTLREELMRKRAIEVVSQVLSQVCDVTYDEAVIWSGVPKRISIMDDNLRVDIKALTWSISNMARGGFRTADYWDLYISAFEALSKAILFDHKELWIDGGWGLSRILHNTHDVDDFYKNIQIPQSFGSRLAEILSESNISVAIPILRILINITSGPTDPCILFRDSQLLSTLVNLMSDNTASCIRRDAFLVVANIVASENPMIDMVINDQDILHGLQAAICVPNHYFNEDTMTWESHQYYLRITTDEDWKVTMEALWIICNIFTVGNDHQIRALLEAYDELPDDLFYLLCHNHESSPVSTCVKLIDAMLDLARRTNQLYTDTNDNPITAQWADRGIGNYLERMARQFQGRSSIVERCEELSWLVYEKSSNVAAAFGLPSRYLTTGANKRRVLHGFEDGDVRLIENAVGKLSI